MLKRILSREFLLEHWLGRVFLPLLTVSTLVLAHVLIFLVAPEEKVMGAVQRIFYFHVPAALATYIMTGVLLLFSVLLLFTRDKQFDLAAKASAELSFVLATIVLVTGMIWGEAAWNTWWRWEPRLVSFLVLWLIFFSYLVLRSVLDGDERLERFCAVLGILAAINIPIVIFSVQLLSPEAQLHPQVVAERGLKEPSYYAALFVSLIAVVSLSLWLYVRRVAGLVLAADVAALRQYRALEE